MMIHPLPRRPRLRPRARPRNKSVVEGGVGGGGTGAGGEDGRERQWHTRHWRYLLLLLLSYLWKNKRDIHTLLGNTHTYTFKRSNTWWLEKKWSIFFRRGDENGCVKRGRTITSQIFFHTYYILFIAYKKTINLSDPSCFTCPLYTYLLLTVPSFSNVI